MICSPPRLAEMVIKFKYGHQSVLLPHQLTNLKILKLHDFSFMESPCLDPMVNLRVLSLTHFAVDGGRFLNGIIGDAPLFEELTLGYMDYLNRRSEETDMLEVCNHPNLKSITVRRCPSPN
ncbi:unnamed protein product [Linum trigynum]|uniref:Uncharacterized protein n=1 Tax=Linum trigynum TaxID=586398 RepID=A0AAV2FCI6_9ROSI